MPRVIRASVADLTRVTPVAGDVFLVDTNVWYWVTYTRASMHPTRPPRPYQTTLYPAFIARVINIGGRLLYAPETFAELAHVIEGMEFNLHVATAGATPGYGLKDFRHDPVHRANVTRELDVAWSQVETMGECLNTQSDAAAIQAALAELCQHQIDGYDAFLVASARAAGIREIVTDDSDYATCAGITVLTAHRGSLAEARAQGRLIVR